MTWEQETLTHLRMETEQRLKKLRCHHEWTSDGPWKMIVEMASGDPVEHLRMLEKHEAEEMLLEREDGSLSNLHSEEEDFEVENDKDQAFVKLGLRKDRSIYRRPSTLDTEKTRPSPETTREELGGEDSEEEEEEDMSWTDLLCLFHWDSLNIILILYHNEAMPTEEGGQYELLSAEAVRRVIIRAAEECFSIVSMGESYITAAIEEHANEEQLFNFRECVRICHTSIHNYQDNHNAAGFSIDQKSEIQRYFDSFAAASGLKLANVFSVLQALGVPCETVSKQKSILSLCNEQDSDKSGVVTFNNFLRLYRRILRDQSYKYRVSEIKIIKNSGFSNAEIQGFRGIFDSAAKLDATGTWTAINIKDMIDLLTGVGVKFSRDEKVTVLKWIKLVDEDNNGELNFGEFCALMGLIWHTNLGNCTQLTKQTCFQRRLTRSMSNFSSPMCSPKQRAQQLKSMESLAELTIPEEVPTTWVSLVIEQDLDEDNSASATFIDRDQPAGRKSRIRRMATDLQKIAAGVVDDSDSNEMDTRAS